jgi:hypothetical protein
MVYGEGKPRHQWNHDTALPRGSLSVRPNDTMDDGISDAILHLDIFHNSSRKNRPRSMSYGKSTAKAPIGKNNLRGDKELILDVNKMLGHFNRYIP